MKKKIHYCQKSSCRKRFETVYNAQLHFKKAHRQENRATERETYSTAS